MSIYEQLKPKLLGKNAFTDIIGQHAVKSQLKSALLTGRHVIIVGPPGIGKTTLSKDVAELLPEIECMDCEFHCLADKPLCPECIEKKTTKKKRITGAERFIRVQGSPDLTAEDLLGDIDPVKALQFGPMSLEAFSPGKIFKANNGVLFFDELNRCPEKLQNALLQVLEERKVTLGTYDLDFVCDFVLIATINPHDSSTEKLSEVLLDRFDMIYMDYPETHAIEEEIITQKAKKTEAAVPQDITDCIVSFVRKIRTDQNLERVPGVRATIGLYERAQSNALIAGRKEVTIKDVKDSIVSVLAHRIKLKPSVQYLQDPVDYMKNQFDDFMHNNIDPSKIPQDESGDDG